jgi:hypothetical protein
VATEAQRHHAVAVMDYMHAHAGQLDYPPGDQRTSRDNISWHLTENALHHVLDTGGRWQGDCSEYASFILKLAGLWHWASPGYTGSHLVLLSQHYTNGKLARPGALVIFGEGTGHHEAVVHTADKQRGDPLCSSHGRPGLQLLAVSEIAAGQPPGVRYLSIAHL